MNGYTVGWLALIGAGAVLELVALVNSTTGDTLSEHLWSWLAIRTKGKPRAAVTPRWTVRIARTVFLGASMWFVLHIWTGGQV